MAPTTVRLNVGGNKYEVAKSLIEIYPNTMLARLVSERWHQEAQKEIFVDRNGVRFQYVLDYMRDQQAHLAVGVSKASVLKELEYFGFEDVPKEAIQSGSANLEVAKHSLMLFKQYKEAIATFEQAKDYTELAYSLYTEFTKTGNFSLVLFFSNKSNQNTFRILRSRSPLQGFNEYLSKYGLEYISHLEEREHVLRVKLQELDIQKN